MLEGALDAALDAALDELGRELPAPARQQLLALAELVDGWATRINLTGHRGVRAILEGLVVEALALEQVLPACASLLDVGSGAGFPGLPIAIVRPECRVTLLEARERRHHFQRAAVRALGLTHVTPLHGRAETLSPSAHELVISQALAEPPRALGLMRPWVAPGGALALAVTDPPEAGTAQRAGLEAAREEIHAYRVPGSARRRTLWLAWAAEDARERVNGDSSS